MATRTRTRTRKAGGTKTTAKRSAAKKTTAKAKGATKRGETQKRNLALSKDVKKLKSEGKTWAEIGKELGIQSTLAIVLYDIAKVKPADKIKEELTGAKVKSLRDKDGLSWSEIAGRRTAGGEYTTIAAVQKLYTEAGGDPRKSGRKGSASAARTASAKKSSGSTAKRSTASKRRGKRRPS